MNSFFSGIRATVVRRRWLVLAVWAALLVFGIDYAPRLQEVFEREFVTGNTGDSQRAADVVAAEFTTRGPFHEQLVFSGDQQVVGDLEYRQAFESVIAVVEQTGLVTSDVPVPVGDD